MTPEQSTQVFYKNLAELYHDGYIPLADVLPYVADLVRVERAAERERCAQVCEDLRLDGTLGRDDFVAAIRALE